MVRKYFFLIGVVVMWCMFIVGAASYAGVPDEISYQGRLREYGQPATGNRTMNFKIYPSATGGIPVWSSGDVIIAVSSGAFNYVLTPIGGIDWRLKDYWLETTISGKTLSPREKLTAQVYAIHSRTAEDVSKSSGSVTIKIGDIKCVVVTTNSVSIEGARVVNVSTPVAYDDSATKGYVDNSLPAGTILMWGGPGGSIPPGWLLCNGAAVSRTAYGRLFAAIGTTHGGGDGSTTFNLPDLRDRFIVGAGLNYAVGNTGGANAVTLTINEIPEHNHGGATGSTDVAHTHTINDPGHSHRTPFTLSNLAASGGWVVARDAGEYGDFTTTNQTGITINNSGPLNHNHTISLQGGGAAHENRPPYFALCYIIKY